LTSSLLILAEPSRYYEEKKKWQKLLREAKQQGPDSGFGADGENAGSSFSLSARKASAVQPSDRADLWAARLAQLQASAEAKCEEAQHLSEENAELRLQLSQAVHSVRNDIHRESDGSLAQEEARELRQRCGELEISLRRKTREHERLERSIQNQAFLEEQLASARMHAKSANEQLERLQSLEGQLRLLQQEKHAWVSTFHEVVQKDARANGGGNGGESTDGPGQAGSKPQQRSPYQVVKKLTYDSVTDENDEYVGEQHPERGSSLAVTPSAVLRVLSSAQQRCVRLTDELSVSKAAIGQARKDSLSALETAEATKAQLAEARRALLVAQDAAAIAPQKIQLYTTEITSLRGLVKSYEAELSLGKPDVASALRAREEAWTQLRADYDAQRLTLSALLDKTASAGLTAGAHVQSEADLQRQRAQEHAVVEWEKCKAQVATLRQDLYALQSAAGMDVVPGRTRVLHAAVNPYQQACQARAAWAERYVQERGTSSLPPVALKAARAELAERAAHRESGNRSAGISGGDHPFDSNVGNQSMLLNSSMDTSISAERGQGNGVGASTGKFASSTGGGSGASSVFAAMGADSNKLNQRLKELFRERIQSFREAVYLLTGYKVDLIFDGEGGSNKAQPKLRLRSMYAEDPEDSLLFTWTGDRLDLMETAYAQRLDAALLENLHRCHSVPTFLSAHTLALFENQTFMG
jgi:hypothetical protein